MRDDRTRRDERSPEQPDAATALHAGHDGTRARRAAALLAVVAALVLPAAALANGDPASHWLLVQDVFFPFERKLSNPVKQDLVSAVARANEAGYPVKTAIVNSPSDLGLVANLFGKPQEYAEFLGDGIGFDFQGHLLVAMPQGLGLSHQGGKPDPQRDAIEGMTVADGADGTGETAALAVSRLATAAGRSGDGGLPVALVVAGGFTLLAAAAVAGLVVLARRRARAAA